MSNNSLLERVEYLKELESMMEELKLEAETIKDELKEEMKERDTEELNLGKYIIRWTSVLTTRFDTKTFKEKFGEDFYNLYTKQVSIVTTFSIQNRKKRSLSGRIGMLLKNRHHQNQPFHGEKFQKNDCTSSTARKQRVFASKSGDDFYFFYYTP